MAAIITTAGEIFGWWIDTDPAAATAGKVIIFILFPTVSFFVTLTPVKVLHLDCRAEDAESEA